MAKRESTFRSAGLHLSLSTPLRPPLIRAQRGEALIWLMVCHFGLVQPGLAGLLDITLKLETELGRVPRLPRCHSVFNGWAAGIRGFIKSLIRPNGSHHHRFALATPVSRKGSQKRPQEHIISRNLFGGGPSRKSYNRSGRRSRTAASLVVTETLVFDGF